MNSVGTGELPLLPFAHHAVSREHLRDTLDEGAREQLDVKLEQGHRLVVVQLGTARDLGAEPNVRISPVGPWRGATEDAPIGVDEEPLDGCWEGLDEAGFYAVGVRRLAIGLVQCGLQVSHGVQLEMGPRSLRDLGQVPVEDRLEAGEVHRALFAQLPPGGVDRCHHILGLRQERLGAGTCTFQRPNESGDFNYMAPLTAFRRWTMSWAWRRQKVLMVWLRLAARSVQRWRMFSSRAGTCLSSCYSSWACVAGRNPGGASLSISVSRSAASEWTPCRAAFNWYAADGVRRQGIVPEDRRLEVLCALRGIPAHRV